VRSDFSRVAVAIALFITLVLPTPAIHASAQQPVISLGFGPTSLEDASQGEPVYAAGDQLWASVAYNGSVDLLLLNPAGAIVAQVDALRGGWPTPLYQFNLTDPTGEWTVAARYSPTDNVSAQFYLNNAIPFALSSLQSYHVTEGGDALLQVALNGSGIYNERVCLTTASPPSTVTVRLPASMGSASLSIGGPVSSPRISVTGVVGAAFDVELDFLKSYSYILQQGNGIVSRELLVARTDPAAVQEGLQRITLAPALHMEAKPRSGSYELRILVTSSAGSSVFREDVLQLSDGSWVWLDGCGTFEPVLGSQFDLSFSLLEDTSFWPALVYTLYDSYGVEGYSLTPLELNLSRVTLVSENAGIQPDGATLALIGMSVPGEVLTNGTLAFVEASSYPATLTLEVLMGTLPVKNYSLTVAGPYSIYNATLPTGELDVSVFKGNESVAGSLVYLTNGLGLNVSKVTDQGGVASFVVPGGNYTLTAILGNASSSENVTVRDGSKVVAEFNLQPSGAAELDYILLVTGLIGAAASLVVWGATVKNWLPAVRKRH
jgi:hypothetical protein